VEGIVLLVAVVAAFAGFDLAAVAFGRDSRDVLRTDQGILG
jgi:hypothetical protein